MGWVVVKPTFPRNKLKAWIRTKGATVGIIWFAMLVKVWALLLQQTSYYFDCSLDFVATYFDRLVTSSISFSTNVRWTLALASILERCNQSSMYSITCRFSLKKLANSSKLSSSFKHLPLRAHYLLINRKQPFNFGYTMRNCYFLYLYNFSQGQPGLFHYTNYIK